MKVCPVCGTENGDQAAFCSRDRSSFRPVAAEALAAVLEARARPRFPDPRYAPMIRQLQDPVPE